ncbi:polysaccharide biosynthesis protein [Planctomycetota bacterium]
MESLTNKTILIPGGTGSFGTVVVDRLLKGDCREIRIFSRDELKQEMMRIKYANTKLKFYIGDVRDKDAVDEAMGGVDLVFHAAALKQVPSCEFFPIQAVKTNILGSHNVITSAIQHRVQAVICLSTDKAAYPVNAMGMTKALMEKVALSSTRMKPDSPTTISCVRYGNVMCSRGSVIPLFIKQIKQNKPLTITVPGMTRFLLPLKDAVDLVLFAFQNASTGDLFIKKAPASTIADLAKAVKNIFNSNVPEQIIGMRHGEKIYETLATREELLRSEDMGDYYRIKPEEMDLGHSNYDKYFTEGNLEEESIKDYTSHNTERLNVKGIEELLLTLPEVRAELNS